MADETGNAERPTEPGSKEFLTSEEVLSPQSLKMVQHSQMLDRWKHVAAASVLALGFIVLCVAILAPFAVLEPFREKAWTLFTVLVSGAAAYLYSSNEEK